LCGGDQLRVICTEGGAAALNALLVLRMSSGGGVAITPSRINMSMNTTPLFHMAHLLR
jgi:hypothetical protein